MRRAIIVSAMLLLPAAPVLAADAGSIEAQSPDQWRVSKLVGVPVNGPGNKNVGKITDVLMSHDGKAEFVIIGVGGFLGIGEKDVAVPFGQVAFAAQPIAQPVNPPPLNNLATASPNPSPGPAAPGSGAAAPNGAVAPSATAGLGVPGDTLGTPTAPAMAGALGTPPATLPPAAVPVPRDTSAPDHGTIDLTAEQLKAAPTFHFAR